MAASCDFISSCSASVCPLPQRTAVDQTPSHVAMRRPRAQVPVSALTSSFTTREFQNYSPWRKAHRKSVARATSSSRSGGEERRAWAATASLPPSSAIAALIFDCDGVILESEDLHRCAYNATFKRFNVRCPGSLRPAVWTAEFYDVLQNKIGGGKPKMRWYFNENGWPSSTILPGPPHSDEQKGHLIDALQDWKTEKYKDMIGSGEVEPRPGVLRLMDEARQKGLRVAVCSAATKSSVVFVLRSLIGEDRFSSLDCFLAGDDVDKKKPDPTIYRVAAQRLALSPARCLVVEDSAIGLQAALGAGMHCICTYTSSTRSQPFEGAAAVYPDLADVHMDHLLSLPLAVTS